MDRCIENCLEFLKGQSTCTATFSEKKFITKIKKLSEKFPETFSIECENEDGSIVAHFPTKFISIKSPRKQLSDEEKAKIRQRLKNDRTK